MEQKLSILRNVALGAGVAFALAFGATQAWARTPCTLPPELTCIGESPTPDAFCSLQCGYYGYYPYGHCLIQEDCCICPEK